MSFLPSVDPDLCTEPYEDAVATGTVVWDKWIFYSDDEMSVWSDDDYPNEPFRVLDYDSPTESEIICMMARRVSSGKRMPKEGARYDSNSFLMVIDNGCSYRITNDKSHFVGTPEERNVRIKGFGGHQVSISLVGTVSWTIPNGDGEPHEDLIPNTHYSETSQYCLYSP